MKQLMPPIHVCPKCGQHVARRGWGSHRTRCGVTDDETLVARLDLDGPNGCWIWTDYTNNMGYGAMNYEGRPMVAIHRLMYQLANGSIPDDIWVLHKCDVPRCCNPAHLYLGTDADNMRDKMLKGRCWSKLKEDQVREIKRAPNHIASSELAKRFGVTYISIWAIRAGRKWKHIQP